MAAESLYVVTGLSGDYEDREEWLVVAYADPAWAEKHRELASEVGGRLNVRYQERMHDWDGFTTVKRGHNPYDKVGPKRGSDFRYIVQTVEMRTDLPAVKQRTRKHPLNRCRTTKKD